MKTIILTSLILTGLFVSACSSSSPTNINSTVSGNKAVTNAAPAASPETAKADEVPASVKAAIPTAQTFTTQHKELSDAQIASIEKDTSGKITEKDHHSYLAFSTATGPRTQVGAATVVKAAGKEFVVVYDNKDGSPVIKEVKAEGFPVGFLNQFVGKGHDNDLLLGVDIKPNGAKDDEAKSVTEAIRIDVLTMQALYGSAHSH